VTFLAPLPPIVADACVVIDVAQAEPLASAAMHEWATDARMILAPPIVWPEMGQAMRKRGLPAADIAARLELIESLGLETADRGPRGVSYAVALAERHRLSVYDATYLWLAIDLDGELATRDKALAKAAVAEGVPLALEP
jgi:predicted nucleic acid-binding protein